MTITTQQALLEQAQPRQAHLDTEIPRLRHRIEQHDRDRDARSARGQQHTPPAGTADHQDSEAARLLRQLPNTWNPQQGGHHASAAAAPRYPDTRRAPGRGRSR